MSMVVIAVVLSALVFDFINGFHDTANAMATSIATGSLRPRVAVLLAGVLNLLTWLLGLPSSSSHALFGGLIGATWVVAGAGAVHGATVVGKVLVPLALSPVVAGLVALAATAVACGEHGEQRSPIGSVWGRRSPSTGVHGRVTNRERPPIGIAWSGISGSGPWLGIGGRQSPAGVTEVNVSVTLPPSSV